MFKITVTPCGRLFYNNFDVNFAVIYFIMFSSLLISFIHFWYSISAIDPAYIDILKIFAGSVGWIGGLTLFMWIREKQKNSLQHIPASIKK